MRRAVVAGALVVAVPVVYFAVTFAQVFAASRHDNARASQAIVVFGAAEYNGRPSKVLAARLDHASSLYHRGLAPVVVVTGGRQPGDRFTEATVSANYLHARGVPDVNVLREVQGRSSWESLAATARFLRARSVRRVLLVSDPFHSYRITAMARELGLDAAASPTRTSTIKGLSELRYMAREAVAVGVARVIGYRREAGVRHASRV